METIHLGYEVGTGKDVSIPILNLAVTGQTQQSGKTTTLEALAVRSNMAVIAFVTKRGEGSFKGGRRIQPYFHDRADWQFVDQLLEAQLKEKNKFLRPWIMKICRTTKTLADVHAAVKKALKTAKGFNEGIYVQLDAYLDLIVPGIQNAKLAPKLDLEVGLNVMDISTYSTPMQMLFVQSAIDWINDRETNVITIIPEAWEFIPEGKGSPVKNSAIALVRKGSQIHNHIWVDSRDMAGVDKTILRGCPVWLMGVQREANEVKRNLLNIPANVKKPKPADITSLELGQFIVCTGTVRTAYVQPIWVSDEDARMVATGEKPIGRVERANFSQVEIVPVPKAVLAAMADIEPITEPEEDMERIAELEKENASLRTQVAELTARVEFLSLGASVPHLHKEELPKLNGSGAAELDTIYQYMLARLRKEEPKVLSVSSQSLRIELEEKIERVEMTSRTAAGVVALLIHEGFFDEGPRNGQSVFDELVRRGIKIAKPGVYTLLRETFVNGGLMREVFRANKGGTFELVEGAKRYVTKK